MRRAAASLPRALYRRADLAAAASALAGRGEFRLAADGTRWRLEVEATGREEPRRLLGELLNEALLRSLRAARLREMGPLAAAVAGRLLAAGFPAEPADPLEQLEPQVGADRARETAALLEDARRRP